MPQVPASWNLGVAVPAVSWLAWDGVKGKLFMHVEGVALADEWSAKCGEDYLYK